MTLGITAMDQFCGCGGTSLAAQLVGIEVKMALNHWKVAVASHNANFPQVDHDCTDISACDPRHYPRTTILLTSPECTNHTKAKGIKRQAAKQEYGSWDIPKVDPAAERSRATMFDVVRFAEHHEFEVILVENVVDVTGWVLFEEWLLMMQKLGYRHEVICYNSMFAPPDPFPVPQSRNRVYIAFWKKGNRTPDLKFTPLAPCPKCDRDVEAVQVWKNPTNRYGSYGEMGQYIYCCPHCVTREVVPYHYPASMVIDWAFPIERIGDRKYPLAEKTLKRIEIGLKKFAHHPYLIELGFCSSENRARDVYTSPYPTQTTVCTAGLVIPPNARQEKVLILPSNVVQAEETGAVRQDGRCPFIVNCYGNSTAQALTVPLGTVATVEHHGICLSAPALSDCSYRTLRPTEIGRAMAFPSDYIVLGTVKDKVKQYGNAITPPVVKMILQRLIATLA